MKRTICTISIILLLVTLLAHKPVFAVSEGLPHDMDVEQLRVEALDFCAGQV